MVLYHNIVDFMSKDGQNIPIRASLQEVGQIPFENLLSESYNYVVDVNFNKLNLNENLFTSIFGTKTIDYASTSSYY